MIAQDIIDNFRKRIDDAIAPYLWTDVEAVEYLNNVIDDFCEEALVLYDASTSAIVEVSVVASTATYSVDDRIVKIDRAKLSNQTNTLDIRDTRYMDKEHGGWQDATNGIPTILIVEGQGTGNARLWPPPAANDTLELGVFKRPTTPITDDDLSVTPEMPTELHRQVYHGMMAQAFEKPDSETYDLRRAERFRQLHETTITAISVKMFRKGSAYRTSTNLEVASVTSRR